MTDTKTAPRQGKIQYSVEGSEIIRAEGSAKEVVALYDEQSGIVEMTEGNGSYRQRCIAHLRHEGLNFKECCKIGTDLNSIPEGAPPKPKKSRQEGEKTEKLVDWYARYDRERFLDRYRIRQMQVLDRIDTKTVHIKDRISGEMVPKTENVYVYRDVDGLDYDVDKLINHQQKLLGDMRRAPYFYATKNDTENDEYDDDLDQQLNDERERAKG